MGSKQEPLREISENIPLLPGDGGMNDQNTLTNRCGERRVAYIYSEEYTSLCDKLPKVQGRCSLVHSLICAYGLHKKMLCVSPKPASEKELKTFHSAEYIECVKRLSNEEDDEKEQDAAEEYGLTYDCPAYPGVFEYASYVAGASLHAAKCILMDKADVAINWGGGWHHAKRDEASGFCYFNDIVVAIMLLYKKYQRILYIDLDLHHGDGVEDAFCATSRVMTVSFHKVSPGFFPGTGELRDVGMGKGKYYSVNVPLRDGIQDDCFVNTFNRVMDLVQASYKPEMVVCQFGADCLADDPMASFNLTIDGYDRCLKKLLSWKKPLMLVGGGGYNLPNTARLWARLTGTACAVDLPKEIPEHRCFPQYGPDYQLEISPGNRKDHNTQSYLDEVITEIEDNLIEISSL